MALYAFSSEEQDSESGDWLLEWRPVDEEGLVIADRVANEVMNRLRTEGRLNPKVKVFVTTEQIDAMTK
jgi:hypothetical protein